MSKPLPVEPPAGDLGARLMHVSRMLEQAVDELKRTLVEIKLKEEGEPGDRSFSSDESGGDDADSC